MALTATATPQAYRTVCLAWIILGTHCLCHLSCLATRIAVNRPKSVAAPYRLFRVVVVPSASLPPAEKSRRPPVDWAICVGPCQPRGPLFHMSVSRKPHQP